MVKIFVGRLAPSVSSTQLRQLFEKYGPVSDCDILRDYAFVHMSHESDALRAINALDKFEFCGSRLSVELSTSRSMKSCQLIVKNLPLGATNEDLHKLFKKFGTVTLCKVNNNVGTVHMRFPSMATNAVRNLSGETYRGNVLSVEYATIATKPTTGRPPNVHSYDNGFAVGRSKPLHTTNNTTWKPPQLEQPSAETIPSNLVNNTQKSNNLSDLREGRRHRIKQGLKFLQSPMPWSGTTEHYETFLNQLKEMLLDEGLELFREGAQQEAVTQLSEAINISHYMKAERINGHLELQDRLFMELAMMKFHMGDKNSALQNANEAFNITQGKNQSVLRFKAKLLSECSRKTEALAFMVKCQSSITFDDESHQLLNMIKESVGLNGNQERSANTKGAIGDGRNRTIPQQANTFQAPFPMPQANAQANRPLWSTNTDNNLNSSNSYMPPFSNFENRGSSLFESSLRDLSDDKLLPPPPAPESHFQQFFKNDVGAITTAFNHQPRPLIDNSVHITGPVSTAINPPISIPNPNFGTASTSSLFSGDPFSFKQLRVSGSVDSSLPLPIGYRRPQSSSFSMGSTQFWNDNSLLGLGGIGSESSVDKSVDEELARAIEDEINVTSGTAMPINISVPYSPPGSLWPNHVEKPDSPQDKHTPRYTHFPSDPSKGGYTGSTVLGPAMLGIHAITGSTPPVTSPEVIQNNEVARPVPPSPPQVPEEVVDENDSLSEILRNPLHDTHEFKLGCTDCVLRTGSRVVDFRHDENLVHSCYKNILLCRRRGNMNWLKIRPRPQPQSKAQLYDGPYYICKDLMSGQDCTYPAVCTFAYNQEEIDVWTLERKGMLNRAWLCKSMDPNFVKNLSFVGLILCKHRGRFDFLCKICFQHKPRIISKFNDNSGKCTNNNCSHRNNVDNQQLTHILREDTVRYTEIRPALQAIMCRHAIRFQCTRGSDCHFAHSLVERDVWAIMNKEGLSASDVVQQSKDHINKQSVLDPTSEIKSLFAPDGCLSEFRWKVKFICSLCHKNGQAVEATKDLKYCSARAQHSWVNNRKVMLVHAKNSWVQVRDLPYLKNKALPVRFELCENYRRQKKCPFSAKCNFAHSQEEMDIWMFLRENQFKDIEELYNALKDLKELKQTRAKRANNQNATPKVTQAESQSLFHCWLCDTELNNKKDWDSHCQSEKHKLMATSDSDGNWKYRRPGGNLELCKKHEKGDCEFDSVPASENMCSYAHSTDELKEWQIRKQYVINRVQKARDDRLIAPAQAMDDLLSSKHKA